MQNTLATLRAFSLSKIEVKSRSYLKISTSISIPNRIQALHLRTYLNAKPAFYAFIIVLHYRRGTVIQARGMKLASWQRYVLKRSGRELELRPIFQKLAIRILITINTLALMIPKKKHKVKPPCIQNPLRMGKDRYPLFKRSRAGSNQLAWASILRLYLYNTKPASPPRPKPLMIAESRDI
jgi:hypothetical protein